MRLIAILAVLFTFAMPALAQEPPKSDSKATLTADEAKMMEDAVDQLQEAASGVELANAKQRSAALLFEARSLLILNERGLSSKTHQVIYVPAADGKPARFEVREKEKPKP